MYTCTSLQLDSKFLERMASKAL